MRGHEALIAMRQRGRRPDSADITVGHDPMQAWADWTYASPWGVIAHLEVPDFDRLSGLDLRCLIGMLVMVHGHDQIRTETVAQLAMEAGAKRVYLTVHNPATHEVVSAAYITEEMPAWQPF